MKSDRLPYEDESGLVGGILPSPDSQVASGRPGRQPEISGWARRSTR